VDNEKKESSRTKKIRDTKIEDDTFGIKRVLKAGALKASELGDKVGFTQEDEYKDKKPVKKAKGGYVKAADGCAKKGKTRGKMI
jgi:hypothetical protein